MARTRSHGGDGRRGGPITQAGKRIASRNALTHGITSTNPVIEGMERESDWLHHLDGIVDSLSPQGGLEQALAERVALLLWRLHRVMRYEVAVTTRQVEDTESQVVLAEAYIQGTLTKGEPPELEPGQIERTQPTRLIPAGDALDKILRYESHLHRQYLQTLHEIEAIQARRSGERAPLARLDISAPPLN